VEKIGQWMAGLFDAPEPTTTKEPDHAAA
jgi:hypothetical protein